MSIVRIVPSEEEAKQPERVIFVDSDAPTNARAILEVDQWCRERGLVRARESYLRTLRTPDGVLVRRAICYRPPLAEDAGAAEAMANIKRHMEAMPETAPVEEDG